MSKAVIVMDMPESCMDCKLKSRLSIPLENVTHCCNLAEGMINLKDGWDKRLDNCPLAELPEKKQETYERVLIAPNNMLMDGWKKKEIDSVAVGYNACIDELLQSSSPKEVRHG